MQRRLGLPSIKISRSFENLVLIVFICLVITVFVTVGISRSYLVQYSELLQKSAAGRLVQVAKESAGLISEDYLESFTKPSDISLRDYRFTQQKLISQANRDNVLNIRYVREKADGQYEFIIDNDLNPNTRIVPGMEAEPNPIYEKAFSGKAVSTKIGDKDGGTSNLISACAPVRSMDGRIIAVVVVDVEDKTLFNIVKQNRNVQTTFTIELIAVILVGIFLMYVLRQRAAEYKEASQAKSTFLSRMSHEIRTPMNAVIGLSRMAWQSDDLIKIHNYLENITNNSTYLLSLLNNILDISKIEAGKMEIENGPVNLGVISISLRTMLTPVAMDKEVNLAFDLDKELPECVTTDSTRLTQILMNLMGNSLKFTPKGGTVDLKIFSLGHDKKMHHIGFSVSDTGIGIEQHNISKLFDAFEQADSGTTRKYGGTGLGLAITKMLVTMLGGEIKVESTIGEGSTFTFDIFAEASDQEGTKRSVPNISNLQGVQKGDMEDTTDPTIYGSDDVIGEKSEDLDLTGKQLLVVEDNEINQLIAEDMFTRMGAEVSFANNGEEGISAFLVEPDRFDIIFMDIQMPIIDGLEATRRIRASGVERAKTIPIIAMTANVFKEDVEKTRAAGMNAHVGKPIEMEQIISAVRSTIDIK